MLALIQNRQDPHEPAEDLMLLHGKAWLSRLSLLCLYPDMSPSRTAGHLAFRRERHFLFKMIRKHRVFEAIVGSRNSDANWLLQQVHLVDKLDTPPLPDFPW